MIRSITINRKEVDMMKKVENYLLLSGGRYTGDFDEINNVPHGYGTYETSNIKYVGLFKQGQFYGHGILEDKQKKYQYNGYFKDNCKHGFGIIKCDNGNYFEGVFDNNIINGIGYQAYSDGEKYIGEYRNNLAYGQGTVYYTNGNVFTGQFINDKEDGIGVIMEHDNNEFAYKVEYHMGEGQILGMMKMTSNLNVHMVYRIVEKEDLFLGMIDKYGKYIKGIWHYANGVIFVGQMNEECKIGTMYYKDGSFCEGYFVFDKPDGKCIYENEHGEIFEGNFVEGKKEGLFIYTNLDEIQEKRLYNEDVLISIERNIQ